MKFINTQPDIIPFLKGNKTWYRLRKNWICYFFINNRWYRFYVYAGFEYDGASIPWIIQPLVKHSIDGVLRSGTLFHDLTYKMNKIFHNGKLFVELKNTCHSSLEEFSGGMWKNTNLLINKEDSDYLMFQISNNTKEVNFSRNTEIIMRLGLSIAGHKKWRKVTPEHEINPCTCSWKF